MTHLQQRWHDFVAEEMPGWTHTLPERYAPGFESLGVLAPGNRRPAKWVDVYVVPEPQPMFAIGDQLPGHVALMLPERLAAPTPEFVAALHKLVGLPPPPPKLWDVAQVDPSMQKIAVVSRVPNVEDGPT